MTNRDSERATEAERRSNRFRYTYVWTVKPSGTLEVELRVSAENAIEARRLVDAFLSDRRADESWRVAGVVRTRSLGRSGFGTRHGPDRSRPRRPSASRGRVIAVPESRTKRNPPRRDRSPD